MTVNFQEDDSKILDLVWDETQIPKLYTPVNNLKLLKSRRLVIIVWYHDVISNGMQVVGQLNVPMLNFISKEHSNVMKAYQFDLTNCNEVVGSIDFELSYSLETARDTNYIQSV